MTPNLPLTAAAIPAAILGAAAMPVPAAAQKLNDGDYAQCEVWRNGEYRGLSESCLARKRAQIRRYESDRRGPGRHPAPSVSVNYCPSYANGGRGYNMTFYNDGRSPSYFGTFDRSLNGRPCIPNPNYLSYGYP